MITSGEIVVRGYSEITKVLQCEMHNEMSMHPRARLICEVPKDIRMLELTKGDSQINIEKSGTKEIIFAGYVEEIELAERQLGYYVLDLQLIGGSILLDQEKRYRSYQDVSLMHKDVIEKVALDTPNVILYSELMEDKAISKPLIQFGESDWEFIKRVASRLNEPSYVDETKSSPRIYVGRNSGYNVGRDIDAKLVSEGIDARCYHFNELAKKNGKAVYYFYKLCGKENYCIGEKVTYKGNEFYIYAKDIILEQEELLYTYTIVREGYLKIPPLYNPKLTGASILGEIKKVNGESMELALHLKDEVDGSVYYAYDWKPEVGNLMYCMPKKGTIVSLYFPSHDEQEAYAVNCIRKLQGEKEYVFDEATKTFLTENCKLMALAPSALHLCAVNNEDDSSYAQLSMIDNLTEVEDNTATAEVEVTDILEKMGLMLASSHDIQMVSTNICLESTYVDLFAGGKISLMTGAMEEGSKANASIELSAAYFSITANGQVLFALTGRVGDNTFCVIWDEPKTAANGWELFRNALVGVVVVAAVAALCLFALPAALGAIGVATATASTIAMGAAVGATATGVFAIFEQHNNDKARGEASSLTDTLKNVGIKTIFGAIEGGFMAIAGAGNIVAEGSRFLCKQTFKNIGKNLLINQAGSFISSTGNVLADAVTGDGITTEEAINYYCEGFVGGLFSSTLDIGKEIPWKKIPLVKNASDWVNQKVIDKVKQSVKSTGFYQNCEEQIAKLMKWAGYYGDYDDYGNADARLVNNIANNESAITTAVDNLNGLPDRIAVASNRVDNLQGDLDSLVNRQVDIGEQLASLTRGVDTKSDELIEDLIGERHYLNAQKEYFERRVRKAIQQLNTLNNRKITNEELIKSLTEVIEDDTERRISDMWGTFAVCSVLKFFDDRVQDFVKKQEPTASITAGIKEVGQWMLEE